MRLLIAIVVCFAPACLAQTFGGGSFGGLTIGGTNAPVNPCPNPPVISAVSSNVPGTVSAGITWTTDLSCTNNAVDFGTTTAYGTTVMTNTARTAQTNFLTGLTANTLYHFHVRDTSSCNDLSTTNADSTFTTACVAPAITVQPQAVTCLTNTTTNFTVTATGTAALSHQWRTNGVTLPNGGRWSGATTATLTLTGALTNDASSLDVVVTNACGSVTSSVATLTVTNGEGGGFASPADYGPILWYDANTTVTNVGGTPAGNTDNVISQGDKSGNGNLLTLSGSSPIYHASAQNGLSAMEFVNGSLCRTNLTQGTVSQPTTFYCTVRWSVNGAFNVIFDGATYAASDLLFYQDIGGHVAGYAGTVVVSGNLPSTGWHQVTVVFDGASSVIRLDGSVVQTGSTMGTSNLIGFREGNRDAGDFPWADEIGEIIGYSGHHDATHLTNIEGWLKSRWATP